MIASGHSKNTRNWCICPRNRRLRRAEERYWQPLGQQQFFLGQRLCHARERAFQVGHGRGEGEPDIALAAKCGAGYYGNSAMLQEIFAESDIGAVLGYPSRMQSADRLAHI